VFLILKNKQVVTLFSKFSRTSLMKIFKWSIFVDTREIITPD